MSDIQNFSHCTAFAGTRRIAQGSVLEVAKAVKRFTDSHPESAVLVFDNQNSSQVELDLRGSEADVVARYQGEGIADSKKEGRGRPKLGVVAREVTLLPRHWDWLAQQPGGASTTLRRLVDDARRSRSSQDCQREVRDAIYKFMTVIAGDRAGYEEALRALYAGHEDLFLQIISSWPADVVQHIRQLLASSRDS